MRDVRCRQYASENFAAEKVIATLHLFMFVLIVGVGVHAQLSTTAPDAASPAAIETAMR